MPQTQVPGNGTSGESEDPGWFPNIGGAFHTGWRGLAEHFDRWAATIGISAAIIIGWIVAVKVYDELTTKTRRVGYGYAFEYRDDIPVLIALLVILAVVGLVLIQMAFARMALAVARRRRIAMAQVWSFERFLTFLGAILIETVVIFAGGPLFLIVAALVLYVPFIVLDRRGSAVTGIFRSISITTAPRRFWPQLLLVFLVAVLTLAACLACYAVGTFIVLATEGDSALVTVLAIAGAIVFALIMAFVWSSLASIYVALDPDAQRSAPTRRTSRAPSGTR